MLLLQAANAITYDDLQGLSYLEVKGSGLANVCPVVAPEGAVDSKGLKSGNFKLAKFCLEPTEFTVKEESQFKGGATEFVPTKLMTRLTYTLDGVSLLLVTLLTFFSHCQSQVPQRPCLCCRWRATSTWTAAATLPWLRRRA